MKWYSYASYTVLNAWSQINSATQSQRVNQQFEIPRWPLTEVPWRALHKFGRNIGDLTGCKTSLGPLLICKYLDIILCILLLKLHFYFLISDCFFIHPIQISLHTTVWPAGADQARQCLCKQHPLGGCLICSSDYLLMPAIQLTIWYSRYQKIAFYWCHTMSIYHLSDKFIIGL